MTSPKRKWDWIIVTQKKIAPGKWVDLSTQPRDRKAYLAAERAIRRMERHRVVFRRVPCAV